LSHLQDRSTRGAGIGPAPQPEGITMTEATDTDLADAIARHDDAVELWVQGLERAARFYRDHPDLVPLTLGCELTEYTCEAPGGPTGTYSPISVTVPERARAYLAELPAPTVEANEQNVQVVDRTTFAPHVVGYHQGAKYLREALGEAVPDRRSGADRRA